MILAFIKIFVNEYARIILVKSGLIYSRMTFEFILPFMKNSRLHNVNILKKYIAEKDGFEILR